jgi:hypothetical protein
MSFLKNLIFAQDENSSEGTSKQAQAPVKPQQTSIKFPEAVQATPIFVFKNMITPKWCGLIT